MPQPARPFPFVHAGASLVLIGLGVLGVSSGAWGATRSASLLLGRVAFFGCVFMLLAGIILGLSALGLFAAETLRTGAEAPGERVPTPLQFVLVYSGSLLIAVLPMILIPSSWPGPALAWGIAWTGGQFLIAATGRPWWLYGTIRRAGWFRSITSDVWMRRLLVALGLMLLASSVLFYNAELAPAT